MKIFISYRRNDTQATAGRMEQYLADLKGVVDDVFLDVDDIGIGENFEQKIERTLARVSHVFVLIGREWLGPVGTSGRTRIFDPDDVVRRETRLALGSRAKLVPILVDQARMPRQDELPEDIRELSLRNGFALRNSRFAQDMDDLLDELLGRTPGQGSRWRLVPLTPAGIALRAVAGLAAGGVLLLGLGLANRYLSPADCYDLTCTLRRSLGLADDDALFLMGLIAIAVPALAALAPFVWRRFRRR